MHPIPRATVAAVALTAALAATGCATTAGAVPAAGAAASIEGSIASIDTQPWTYDGNAVVEVDTAAQGRIAVQLPARWNLCKATPVDVDALAVGMRVRAVGTRGAGSTLVVCEDASHRLVPVE